MEFSYSSRYNGDFDRVNKIMNEMDTLNMKPTNFVGKVTTSVIECPHIFWTKLNQTTLATPSQMADTISQVAIDLVKTLNGSVDTRATTTNLGYGQHLFSFNVVEEIERRLGSWVFIGCNTVAVKVAKVRQIVTQFIFNWNGYGSSPTGNKASLQLWFGSSWVIAGTHTNATVSKIYTTQTTMINRIQDDGYIHLLANADPSNGVVASSISTDYVELILTVKI